jgi:RimJ/RimL family protein N-acetyltransferase
MTDNSHLSVRELAYSDIEHIVQYWLTSDEAFMLGMGVDIKKIPPAEKWKQMLSEQILQPYNEKQSYCIIWQINGQPVGHSNVNQVVFAKEAYMHLHIWKPAERQKGAGAAFVQKSIPYFFENMQLQTLYCQPYALNPAPNHTLKKVGFEFIKQYRTIPGWLNFEQEVNLYQLTREKFELLYLTV